MKKIKQIFQLNKLGKNIIQMENKLIKDFCSMHIIKKSQKTITKNNKL
jgi:hypothetical protein